MEKKIPQIIELPKMLDDRGNLSFLEENNHVSFAIERVYWIYDVPGGETRGGHSYIKNEEFIIAISGSLDIVLHDGKETTRFSLNRSYYGLYIPNGYWRHMENFSTNSLAFVAASTKYNADDYIRSFDQFTDMQK